MMIDKALLTGAFEKMGADAVERGLRLHRMVEFDAFHACFLARAYGKCGEMNRAMEAHCADAIWYPMGLTGDEFDAVWETIDEHPRQFRALAREWTRGTSFVLAMGRTQVATLVALDASANRAPIGSA